MSAFHSPIYARVASGVASVQPTSTIILAATPARGAERWAVYLKNTDNSQTLTLVLEKRADSTADWVPWPTQAFQMMLPGEVRYETFDVFGVGELRIAGTADGLGNAMVPFFVDAYWMPVGGPW